MLKPAVLALGKVVGWSMVAGLVTATSVAYGFDIDTGSRDISIRWDNTLRYNNLHRIQARDARIELAAPRSVSADFVPNGYVFDGAEYFADKNETISSRLDLLSELDLNYQGRFGARLSAALWYDMAFPGRPRYSPSNYTSTDGHGYVSDKWSDYVKRYYEGPSGEFLDAFIFANLKVGGSVWNLKFGRHAVVWGEGLVGSAHSVAYSQAPSDGMKSATNPGASAKETAMPVTQLSVIGQVHPTVTVLGQYMVDWRSSRYPEGSTYFAGSNYGVVQGSGLNRGKPSEGDRGNWGLGLKWSPEWLDGTVGFYYREFDDFNPWAAQAAPMGGVNLNITRAVYLKDVALWGVTLSKSIAGISVGAELSHRHNAALSSSTTGSAAVSNAGAIGDTWHALVNGVASYSGGPWGIWSTASLVGEIAWSGLDKVNENKTLFRGKGAGYWATCRTATASIRGCYDGTASSGTVIFTPVWQQVMPGVDLSLPFLLAAGLNGNAPTNGGGSEGFKVFKVGLSANAYSQHQMDLSYTWHNQNYDQASRRWQGPGYQDKGYLAFTYQTTF